MHPSHRQFLALALASALPAVGPQALVAADKEMIPSQLTKLQRETLTRFLQSHDKPDRFFPRDARVVGAQEQTIDANSENAASQKFKQYTVQITPHRPVPDQKEVRRVDVYYYRTNPEKGKPGITVKHTVDVTNGEQVGPTEVLLNHHTPISRDELGEAVELAKEKSTAVSDLYKDREKTAVRWEYLQLMINRKHEAHEPGDRVVRLVFTAAVDDGQTAPTPVRVIVNLTKGVVSPDPR